MALKYLGASIMSLTKDLLDNPASATQTDQLITAIARDYPTINILDVTIPMNTNAQALATRGSSFAIEPATYAAQFNSKIHAVGKHVYWRGTDCSFEGLYNFPQTNYKNGNRYTFFGDTLTDNFSSIVTRSHGYGKSSAAGNLSTNYLTSHQSGNDWSISGSELVGPAANGWVRTILFNAPYPRDVTMVAKVQKVGHQQIIVRATTDSNAPGYGLQMRNTNVLRIERPGLASLGETSKTWVEGNWYWLKLQAIGSAIKGKAWSADDATYPNSTSGSENEPGAWDLEVTDSSYANSGVGYFGFSGESANGHFKYLNLTPEVDTDSFIYRTCGWIRDNMSIFSSGDVISPYPEASSHQDLTTQGTYINFFLDLKYIIERLGTEAGKTLVSGYFSHLWTSVVQNAYAAQFADAGAATYDHYSVALGRGFRFQSYGAGSVSDSNTYTVPTSITENATNREDFFPEKVSYNQSIDVYIVNKGTGNWTMTIHTGSNALVQMCDSTNFASKTTTGVVTVPNASLTNGALNRFNINWDNPLPDVQYHFHLTSTVGDGTVKTTTSNDLNTVYNNGYKGYASADALEIDIRKTYAITGVPQFLGELGDFWSTDASRTTPILSQAEHITYLQSITASLQRLINEGILIGFCYWRLLGANEGIMYDADAGAGYDYQQLYSGSVWQAFFNANIPNDNVSSTTTSTSSTTTSTSTSTSTSTTKTIPYGFVVSRGTQ